MKKILIVDHRQEIRDLLEETFERSGYRTFCAEGGDEAVRIAMRENPDIIMMDLMALEEVSEIEINNIRGAIPETSECALCMLAGDTDDLTRMREVQDVTENFLRKTTSDRG